MTLKMWERKYGFWKIEKRFKNFKPKMVKRIEIPKDNGKSRPLGIPTIEDRIIQMMFKEVLEKILESKFYPHSFGFRPKRSAENAIAQSSSYMSQSKLHYSVDIDIKGYFDNINHNKLIKQLWKLGIKDKRVLTMIKRMLKAPIKMLDGSIESPIKGTPQGGILSPLLANVYLNELDWWIDRQWRGIKTRYEYSSRSKKYRAIRNTKLTEMMIVRYADDFKIFCPNRNMADKTFKKVKNYLKHKLRLDISKEKSKVVNNRKKCSEFLGFEMKLYKTKKDKYVTRTKIKKKSKKRIVKELTKTLKEIRTGNRYKLALKYNAQVRGIQNYYRIATGCARDFGDIGFIINKVMYNRKNVLQRKGKKSPSYLERYKGHNMITYNVGSVTLFTIQTCKFRIPMHYSDKTINKYSPKVELEKNNEKIETQIINSPQEDIQWQIKRLEVYNLQKGKCKITGDFVKHDAFEIHHVIPRKYGGTDEIENLIMIKPEIHKAIHYGLSIKILEENYPKIKKFRKIILNLNK